MPQDSYQGSLVNAEDEDIPDGTHQRRPLEGGGSDIGTQSLMGCWQVKVGEVAEQTALRRVQVQESMQMQGHE